MASSKSVIQVSIIGDAKKLIGAVGAADKATGGLVKSAAKVAVASVGVRKGFDLIGDSLSEADRRGDAIDRIRDKLGALAEPLIETAGNFTDIGASSQDMLELEAAYADLATSAGIAAPDIAANAEKLAASASAAALVRDEDPSAIIDAIGKAAGGATRGLKPYGVDLTEAAVQQRALHDTGKDNPKLLTDTELAAARTALIIEGFATQLGKATQGSGDLGDKQDILGAKLEEAGGKVGGLVQGPLTELLEIIIKITDMTPAAGDGFGMLGDRINAVAGSIQGPLNNLRSTIADIIDGLSDLRTKTSGNFDQFDQASKGHSRDADIAAAQQRDRERNGLGR